MKIRQSDNLNVYSRIPEATSVTPGENQPLILKDQWQTKGELPIDKNKLRKEIIKEYSGRGAAAGFISGSTISIVGIPVTVTVYAESTKKISMTKSRAINKMLVPITFPGVLLGAIGMGIGAAIGNLVGHVKARSILKNIHD